MSGLSAACGTPRYWRTLSLTLLYVSFHPLLCRGDEGLEAGLSMAGTGAILANLALSHVEAEEVEPHPAQQQNTRLNLVGGRVIGSCTLYLLGVLATLACAVGGVFWSYTYYIAVSSRCQAPWGRRGRRGARHLREALWASNQPCQRAILDSR